MLPAVQSYSTSIWWRIGIAALAFTAFGWPLATAVEAAPAKAPVSTAEVPYGVGDWPESNGNHRAVVRVAQPAEIVQVRIPWRRRDEQPDAKEILLVDAKTGRRVDNLLRVEINREFGWLLFEPMTAPGDYFVYYMPFRNAGSWWAPTATYLPPVETAKPEWAAKARAVAKRLQAGAAAGIPSADVVAIQAINDFHRFDPMEIVATAAEMKALLTANAKRPYLVFAEDRTFPIRMTDELPLRWIKAGPSDTFSGEACRGEFYPYQLGVFASGRALVDVKIEFGNLTSAAGDSIPAAAMRCFNTGGVDWLGRTFKKTVNVPQDQVQALWCGIAVPKDIQPGVYRGDVTVRARGAAPTPVKLALSIADRMLDDSGDREPWRLSRLRWLDSTIGLDNEVCAPFKPVEFDGRTARILGRTARLADGGLLASITSSFSRNVDATNAAPREILAAPMRLAVESAAGSELAWKPGPTKVTLQAPGAIAWESTSAAGPLQLACQAKLECDGYVNFKLTLKATEATQLKNIRLLIPLRREIATYMMGMGCKGGLRPKQWQWKWDVNRSNNQLWIGDVNAGLSCKLKHTEDRWDLYNLRDSGIYRDWGNAGAGGCDVGDDGPDQVVVSAYTGPRKVAAGEELHFNFGLLITPLKPLDPDHWKWRYFQAHNGLPPISAIAPTGATVVNVHQGDPLNPYINYPLAAADKLSAYAADAHARQMKLKIYYTIRELSNYATELWALRSLGDEVYLRGSGFKLADQFDAGKHTESPLAGGGSWLREHLIRGYVPAWHTPLSNGRCDASIATTGLSRWHNYYIEGLAWLIKNVGIDGLYLDGVGYDREIMKRVRKTMQRTKPGCLIDFHSGNNFDPNFGLNSPANQYLELFPYLDSLWFGEGFNYNESPDYWLIEISGIPYGLFGEMLQGGGNPWRGMIYGMTNRLGWSGDPRPLWKLWDSFGIQDAHMIGYWDDACPVKTGRKDVLATAYVRAGKTLVAIASWSSAPVDLKLDVDFKALGLDPHRAHLFAPTIAGVQGRRVFQPDEAIPVEPGRGWLLLLDEQSHEPPTAAEVFPGRKALLVEDFRGTALNPAWTVTTSKHPGTAVTVGGGELRIAAAANVVAYAERSLPPNWTAVCCTVDQGTDTGATWGPGLSLVWRDGRTLRVNLRADGRFGVDNGGQKLVDINLDGSQFTLTMEWTADAISIRATCDGRQWQDIAHFPRKEFPGNPISVRIGKTDQHSGGTDFTTPGPRGVATISNVRAVGR